MKLFRFSSGVHRSMPAAQLRDECRRLSRQVQDLERRLVQAEGEVEDAHRARDEYVIRLGSAGDRIEELESQVRDRARLVQANVALRAALQNAHKVHSLGATARPSAAELAAAGRTSADTVEMDTLTLPGWSAPTVKAVPAPPPADGQRIHSLSHADALGLLRRTTSATAHSADADPYPHTTTRSSR